MDKRQTEKSEDTRKKENPIDADLLRMRRASLAFVSKQDGFVNGKGKR